MSHVDEGRLHALLDGALAPGTPEHRDVEAHLKQCADCRARLEAAREERAGASELLGLLGPDVIEGPAFDELKARGGPGSAPPVSTRRGRPWTGLPLAWAASIAVAIGGGWLGHAAWDRPGTMQSSSDTQATATGGELAREPAPVAEEGARAADPSTAADPDVAADVTGRVAAEAAPPASAPPARAEPAPVPGAAVLDFDALAEAAVDPDLVALARVLADAETRADAAGAWRPVTPAQAAVHLGQPAFEPAALPWDRMEAATVEGRALVRTQHPLADGETAELVQATWAGASPVHDVEGGGAAAAQERAARADLPTGPRPPDAADIDEAAMLFVPAAPPSPERAALAVHLAGTRLGLTLRAPGDRARLEALWTRMR